MSLVDTLRSLAPMTFVTASAVVLVTAGYFVNKEQKKSKSQTRKRSMSYSSEQLINGAFPNESNVMQPVVNTLVYLSECPTIDELSNQLKQSLLLYDRFRSGAKKVNGKWELIELGKDYDPREYVISSHEFNSEEEIKSEINRLIMVPLEISENLPMWRIYRLVNKNKEENSALFARVHHCIGDGISLVSSMTKLFKKENGEDFSFDIPEKMRRNDKKNSLNNKNNTQKNSKLIKFVNRILFNNVIFIRLKILFKFLFGFVQVLGLSVSRFDTSTFFFSHKKNEDYIMTGKRVHLELPVLSLDIVKRLKNRANVTVNDVLMSVSSGMIYRYALKTGDKSVEDPNFLFRALLPVAFPRSKKDLNNMSKAMSNKWSFASIRFLINPAVSYINLNKFNTFLNNSANSATNGIVEENLTPDMSRSKRRLELTSFLTKSELKKSLAPYCQLLIQNYVLPLLPLFLRRKAAQDVFTRHSLVFSNVPGPDHSLAICKLYYYSLLLLLF